MSKVSTTQSTPTASYPTYADSSVSVNGDEKATISFSDGTINSNYNMNENEKAIYDYAQSTLASIIPSMNVFSQQTQDNLQNQMDAYQAQGVDTINQVYTPMLNDLKDDIASRFGNFDNSIFMDNLGDIESSRADAVSALSQDMIAKQNSLVNSELQNRYDYVNFLNSIQAQGYENALNTLSYSLNSNNSANSYNNSGYNALNSQLYGSSVSPELATSLLMNSLNFI